MIIEIYSFSPNPNPNPAERWRQQLKTLTDTQKRRFRDLLKWTFQSADLTVEMKENLVDELIPYVKKETEKETP